MAKCNVEQWNKALEYFTERLPTYEVVYCDDGHFRCSYDITQIVKDNALMCVMRSDYIQKSDGPLRGKELNFVLKEFVKAIKERLHRCIKDPTYSANVREK
jgi:hypothetical protein